MTAKAQAPTYTCHDGQAHQVTWDGTNRTGHCMECWQTYIILDELDTNLSYFALHYLIRERHEIIEWP